MTNNRQKLYVIAEKQYSNTTWYNCVIEGLYKEAAKRMLQVCIGQEKDLQNLPKESITVLLGSSLPFITECINLCLARELRPIVAGFEIFQSNLQVSYITINRRQAMSEVIKNLISCGAKRIALLGINSSIQTDMLRYDGWSHVIRAYQTGDPETDVYYSDNGMFDCLNKFWANYRKYDAVACANDYYAAYLLSEANKRHVAVPEDLMVTGFGNTNISNYTSPTLTTVALNLPSVGAQVVQLYRNLIKNPDLLSCTATLRSEIIPRESTKQLSTPIETKIIFLEEIGSAFEPTFERDLKPIYALENAIVNMDEIDQQMIHGLLQNISYNELAEQLYLSDSAFKYRLYKLFSTTGTENRAELVKVFNNYIPLYAREQHRTYNP